jgi:DNA mismatch repair ATPase MutS
MQAKIYKILNNIENQLENQLEKGKNNKEEKNTYIETTSFKLPITYITDKYLIQECIKSDLELCNIERENNITPSLYIYLFNPASEYANKIIPMLGEYYTTNTRFLDDSKHLIKNLKYIDSPNSTNVIENINNVTEILQEINQETGFYEKYKYININLFKFLNKNSFFLQGLTIYNLATPIISLMIPILMLLIPFLILKLQRTPISIGTYFTILKSVMKNHVIGKAITDFANVGWDRRFFLLISVALYVINIYQNIITCKTFYKNIYKIRQYLLSINEFITYSINSITNINKYCKSSYSDFVNKNESIKSVLYGFSNEITSIKLDKISIRQITKIGEILRSFYQLFKNIIYKDAIIYSLYLHGYIECISNLQNNIKKKYLNYCDFTNKITQFKDAYFAPLVNNKPVKNSYKLTKNIIITGPNAAGKTTLLKTTLFNIILSQQFGVGFYKSAKVNPYKYIHSYINIPDTSERDSLFQAEARRCKEILDYITDSSASERHFCIFDEIYSGTNPNEAIASAYAFLKYISEFKNIDYMLTTHYISLCNMIDKNKNIINKQMDYKDDKDGNPNYTYKIMNGISNIKGGIKVLEELNYSDEIIEAAKEVMQKNI